MEEIRQEMERKEVRIEGIKAVEKKKREKRKKELFELLELDERYVRREEVKLWIALSNLPKKFFAFIAKKVCDVCKKLLGGG